MPVHHYCPDCGGPMKVKLYRVYARGGGHGTGFIPLGWICPQCERIFNDEGEALYEKVGGNNPS